MFTPSICTCLPQTVALYARGQWESTQAEGKSASYWIGTPPPAKRSNSSFDKPIEIQLTSYTFCQWQEESRQPRNLQH